VRTFLVAGAKDVVVAPDKSLWILTANAVMQYSSLGKMTGVKLPDVGSPTAISFDNKKRLLVCDNGARRQVLVYDVKKKVRRVGVFGEKGGIMAGVPGAVAPKKLYSLAGAGTDAQGNLYVALSRGTADGLVLRQFQSDGKGNWNTPGWEVYGVPFVDGAVPLPGSDGKQVYTRSYRFALDYDAASGPQGSMVGYTLSPSATAQNDARVKDPAYHPAFVRELKGRHVFYMTPMMSGAMHLYVRDGETEFLKPIYNWDKRLGWGIFPDMNGDIWEVGGKTIRCTPFTGFDAAGKPQFGTAQEWPAPAPFSDLQRVVYLPQTDTLLLAGYTPDKKEQTWGIIGKEMMRIEGWRKGNRAATWTMNVPHDWTPAKGPRVIMKTMTVEGDYIFMAGVETRAQVWVFRLSDGAFVGVMNPGAVVGGADATGWVDIVEGISATRRANGEYVIFLEEDLRNKIIVYRWKP
jgi:hypothetical protein